MIKVLIASHQGYPWGGISEFTQGLLTSGLKDKVELFFVETSKGKKSFSSTGRFGSKNLILSFLDIARFTKEVISKNPTLVHISTAYDFSLYKHGVMVIIAKVLQKKVLLSPHCSIGKIFPNNRFLYRKWASIIISLCDALIVLSKEWLEIKEKVKDGEIYYLQNAINLSEYKQIHKHDKSHSETVHILFLGHIGQQKGIVDLINASKLIKDKQIENFKIHIYGEALEKGDVEQILLKITQLKIEANIKIYHPIFGEQKLIAFQQADIFVLPSYHEGMPISIIEAMAAELPIIATNVGGIPDLVDDGKTGILFTPGNTEKLADALTKLISEPNIRREMGSAGRAKALRNNDIEKYAMELFDIYEEVTFSKSDN